MAALVRASYRNRSFSWTDDALPAFLTLLFGALLGASEIISRYRDEPLKAVFNRYGLTYVGTNAAISLCALMLLERYQKQLLPSTVDAGDGIVMAFFAGFGAMVILRSKLFLYQTNDGKEIPIGPDLIADRFLKVIDRKIDRQRAASRERLVFTLMHQYTSFPAASKFFRVSLGSFQNLSGEEKKYYSDQAEKLLTLDLPEVLKAMALGFLFLDISGEENLRDVCDILNQHLATGATTSAAANQTATSAPAPHPP